MAEPLIQGGSFGVAKSPEEAARSKAISDAMIEIWNREPDIGLQTMASAFLTVCLNQENPVEVYNLITMNVAAAIRMHVTDVAGNG